MLYHVGERGLAKNIAELQATGLEKQEWIDKLVRAASSGASEMQWSS